MRTEGTEAGKLGSWEAGKLTKMAELIGPRE